MSATGVSPVNAYTAHHEWANRPADERYTSVEALFEAARARHRQTVEYEVEARRLRVEAIDSQKLRLQDTSQQPIGFTHWSFGQLASIAAAPAHYLRTLPAPIAADALNYGLARQSRDSHQVYLDGREHPTALALTSPRYVRVHHDQLAGRVLDLMASHAAWQLPAAYKGGKWGAERVPSGAYLGDRDMFLFLIDGNRDLDDPSDRDGGLFRGFILRNSDVGAAALTLDLFLFRRVCANHIIWGFDRLASFRRRHVGGSIEVDWDVSLEAVSRALDADTAADRNTIYRATSRELGASRDAVIEATTARGDLTRKQANEAYELAEEHESNPRSLWGFVQGLTRLSQRSPWQDQRYTLDRLASRLLTSVR